MFSTAQNTHRNSQNWIEKRRGREEGDRDEQEEKKGDSRGERQIYAVFCSQRCLCTPDTHKDSQNLIGRRRGKEEIEVF